LANATKGPWVASLEQVQLSALGRGEVDDEIYCTAHHEVWRVDTGWNDPELGGRLPVVSTGYYPCGDPAVGLAIRDRDVALIANAPEDLRYLLELVERLLPAPHGGSDHEAVPRSEA
jgi:hypothetical protein